MATNIQRIALTAWAGAQKSPLDFASLTAWLRERGFEVHLDLDTAEMAGEKTGLPREEVVKRADLVIVFGGDGSMLRTAHNIGEESPLLLGINTGHLGFLADIPQAELYPALERILINKEFSTESRMRLGASVQKKRGRAAGALRFAERHRAHHRTPGPHGRIRDSDGRPPPRLFPRRRPHHRHPHRLHGLFPLSGRASRAA